jgi:hypothetical protein
MGAILKLLLLPKTIWRSLSSNLEVTLRPPS